MWKWQKPSPYERNYHSVFSVLAFDYTRSVCSTVIIGVGRHWQGGDHGPLLARKFFHFDHWSDQKAGSPPPLRKLKNSWGAPRNPLLEKFLPMTLTVVIGITSTRLVPRALAGIFLGRSLRQVKGWDSSHFSHSRIRFLVASMVKM